MSPRRYPLAPLAEAAGCSLASLGRRVGASGSVWKQYRDHGVSELVADRYAVRLGLHPYEVWPDMADEAIKNAYEPCEECGEPFIPGRAWQRFCAERCRVRASNAKRGPDPKVSERSARWRAANLEERRAYNARWMRDKRRRERSRSDAAPEPMRGKNGDNVTGNNAQDFSPGDGDPQAESQGCGTTSPQGESGMVA